MLFETKLKLYETTATYRHKKFSTTRLLLLLLLLLFVMREISLFEENEVINVRHDNKDNSPLQRCKITFSHEIRSSFSCRSRVDSHKQR